MDRKVEVKAVSDPFMDLKLMAYQVMYEMCTISSWHHRHANHHLHQWFGRIGRLAFCAVIANLRVEVKAVSDPFMDLKLMVYQVKYKEK